MAKTERFKYLWAHMFVDGKQHCVYAKTTYADFMAMTGVGRDYIGETSNAGVVAHLDAFVPNTLWRHADEGRDGRWVPVPEERMLHRSAQDKRAALAREKNEREARRNDQQVRLEAAREAARRARVERVAVKLYDLDRQNVAWDDADETVREHYRWRAGEVIAVL